ncbi:heme ABC exporter ATP-binding protein CcmA [Novispirillum itersonii]|uniref:heme ABC exporter ATP-binding protein CcmA n=1 Tax=Novispirillum itersonii TaxID=189 RepID=UPI001619E907|nr:heme ABC exporter ATP-binding protein CcmA [Novispirillum itersonii]
MTDAEIPPATPPVPSVDAPVFAGRGLTCIRGDRVVFTDLSFTLAPGQALLLLGPNGSGKSSLLRLMAGLLHPAMGDVLWQEESIFSDREGHGSRTRYIGHQDAIKPVLTVRENIGFWVRQWQPDCPAAQADAQVEAAVARFDMTRLLEVPGKMLSAGQKRRTNLSRLFAAPAPLWLLDEPTTALDRASVAVLEQAIAGHRAAGGMVVLSTHIDVALPGAQEFRMDRFAPRHRYDFDEDGED